MTITKANPRDRKALVFGGIFILLGILAIIFTPGNYWLYANILIGITFVIGYFYDVKS